MLSVTLRSDDDSIAVFTLDDDTDSDETYATVARFAIGDELDDTDLTAALTAALATAPPGVDRVTVWDDDIAADFHLGDPELPPPRFQPVEGIVAFRDTNGTQARDWHGRWSAGGASYGGREHAQAHAEGDIVIAEGRVKVPRAQLLALLADLGQRPGASDLTLVDVEGTDLFGSVAAAKLRRIDMPQIPSGLVGDFEDYLTDRGVRMRVRSVDPLSLKAMQNELNGRTVGQMVARMQRGQMLNETNPVWISSDNFILDGHHRWAAEAAMAIGGVGRRMTVQRVNLPMTTLIAMAREFNVEAGIESHEWDKPMDPKWASLAAAAQFRDTDGTQARDDQGQWTATGSSSKIVKTKSIPNVPTDRLRDSLAQIHDSVHTPEGIAAWQDTRRGMLNMGIKAKKIAAELIKRGDPEPACLFCRPFPPGSPPAPERHSPGHAERNKRRGLSIEAFRDTNGRQARDERGKWSDTGASLRDVPFKDVKIAYRPRHPDGHADPGEIVWADVPYEEGDGRSKNRPVLVIGRTADGKNLVALQMTSKPGAGRRPLGEGSFLKFDRFIQIDKRNYRKEKAYMKKALFQEIVDELTARQHAPDVDLAVRAEFRDTDGTQGRDDHGRWSPGGGRGKLPKGDTETWADNLSAQDTDQKVIDGVAAEFRAAISADAEVRVRFPTAQVERIAREGFLTQHDTGASQGTLDPALRRAVEERMFSAPDTKPTYGYAAVGASHAEQNRLWYYGKFSAVLTPEAAARTTVTRGDSLVTTGTTSASLDRLPAPILLSEVATATNTRLFHASPEVSSPADVSYYETQTHGGVRPTDIAKIIVPPHYPWSGPAETVRAGVPPKPGWRRRIDRFTGGKTLQELFPHAEIVYANEGENYSVDRAEFRDVDGTQARGPDGKWSAGGGRGKLPKGDTETWATKMMGDSKPDLTRSEMARNISHNATQFKQAITADTDVRIRVSGLLLGRIAKEGFLTQHETGDTGGIFNPALREAVEGRMFSADGTKPVYGYAGVNKGPLSANMVGTYGSYAVVLTDEARSRTTVVRGDSLRPSNATPDELDWSPAPILMSEAHTASNERLWAASTETYPAPEQPSYYETQTHGGVRPQDIAKIIVPTGAMTVTRDGVIRSERWGGKTLEELFPHAEIVYAKAYENYSVDRAEFRDTDGTQPRDDHGRWSPGNTSGPDISPRVDRTAAGERTNTKPSLGPHAHLSDFAKADQKKMVADFVRSTGLKHLKTAEDVVNFLAEETERQMEAALALDPGLTDQYWYEAAHSEAAELSNGHGAKSSALGSGLIAVMSPQTPYPDNVAMAREISRLYGRDGKNTIDAVTLRDAYNDPNNKEMKKVRAAMSEAEFLAQNSGKTWGTIETVLGGALFKSHLQFSRPVIRAVDQVLTKGGHGEFTETLGSGIVAKDGSAGWKALEILNAHRDHGETQAFHDVLSNRLGNGSKVRSFYNNINNPASADYVTIDTHAASGMTGFPGGGGTPYVKSVMSHGTTTLGMSQSYPLYQEALNRVAAKYKMLPRGVQSVTWVQQRDVEWPDTVKSKYAGTGNATKPQVSHLQHQMAISARGAAGVRAGRVYRDKVRDLLRERAQKLAGEKPAATRARVASINARLDALDAGLGLTTAELRRARRLAAPSAVYNAELRAGVHVP